MSETADAEPRDRSGENRLPPAVAVVVAIVAYALLPSSLLLTGRLATPIVEALLLIALIATNPRRMSRETRWSRGASVALSAVMILTNLASLGMLVAAITGSKPDGARLLVAAVQIWGTNVIGFALMYWEMDRGGPVSRARRKRADLPLADWRFTQDEDEDTVLEVKRGSSPVSGWMPTFIDYLYLSLTNSSAFSPTDTMPLSPRAKILMGIQACAALFTSLVLVAFAVSSLGS